jgi:hypothetical protein
MIGKISTEKKMNKKFHTNIFRGSAACLLVTFLLALTLNACGPVTAVPIQTPSQPSEQITYYYFVKDNSFPEGSVEIFPPLNIVLAPTQSAMTRSTDTAANIRSALQAVFEDPRNIWEANLSVLNVTFREGHIDIDLQAGNFGAGDIFTHKSLRLQILLTVFAESPVQTATVTIAGENIGNLGNTEEYVPGDYAYTRAEIETYMTENAYSPTP